MKVFLLGVIAASSITFAHGPVAEQASEAVKSATKLFLASQLKEVTKLFDSVFAELAGVERFNVTVTLRDKTTKFSYNCSENELVDPVVWECE